MCSLRSVRGKTNTIALFPQRGIAFSLALGLLLIVASSGALGQSVDPDATPDPQSTDAFADPDHFAQRDGKALFQSICQGCHMPDAQGAVGAGAYPTLANNPKLAASRYTVSVVLNGQKGMPPFGEYLNDDQVAAVVNYVRTHFGNNYKDMVSRNDVKAIR